MQRGFGVTVFGASMVCAVHAQLQAQPQAQSQGQSQTQTPSTPHSPSSSPHSVEVPLQAGERLSESLLRAVGPLAEGSAVHWLAAAEQDAQHRMRQDLLHALRSDRLTGLRHWLAAQPVTGRVALESGLARSLQVRPTSDPIPGPQDRVRWFARPTQVGVLNDQGQICLVQHTPGALAADYLQRCDRAASGNQTGDGARDGARDRIRVSPVAPADHAWIVQPDARVHRAGVQPWSMSRQPEPAPGAWLFAPGADSPLTREQSQQIADILATLAPPEFIAPEDRLPRLSGPVSIAPDSLSVRNPRPADLALTASDWGEIGLLQTPTARMAPSGAARFTLSRISPYTHGNVMLQPLDWLEFGFRYTNQANRLYGPAIAGNQDYKDKSIDFKLRVLEESAWRPQLALGIRDFGGTGLFSGEYVVASKRWGPWDFSLGMGWGYLGARGDLGNPLSLLGERWRTRAAAQVGQGGTPAIDTFFRGPTALFGGVQYQLDERWVLKAEYEGNDYRNEPLGTSQRQSSPVNLGLVYRSTPWMDWVIALERGNALMLGLTLHTGPSGLPALSTPKVLDPPLPPIHLLPPTPPDASPRIPSVPTSESRVPLAESRAPTAESGPHPALSETPVQALKKAVREQTGWRLQSLAVSGEQASAVLETDGGVHARHRVQKVSRLLHASLPAQVRRFTLDLRQRGLRLTRITIDRSQWVREQTEALPPSQRDSALVIQSPGSSEEPSIARPALSLPDPAQSVQIGPSYQQILGGPDAFLLFKLGARLDAQWRFTPGTWLSGSVDLRVIDNFDRFKYTAPSDLPRVRTFAREYATSSRLTLPHLQATHVQALGAGHFASIYGGMLEPMFGGVGAEWFWRPWNSRWAWGMDINRVRQRDFQQDFGFRDYQVTTGHLSAYWDTGWHDIQAKLMIGQYLAGDLGATLDLRRQFRNGVSVGAWATKTNVSAAQFGEGSFDKGIYLILPFDTLLARSTPGSANIIWNPLTRDGGARLQRRDTLEELTRQGAVRTWSLVAPPLVAPQ